MTSGGHGPARPAPAVLAVAEALGPRAATDAPLGARTTYRVGGTGAVYIEVGAHSDLAALHEALVTVAAPVPVLVVGKGSNLLVADAGFPGLVVALGRDFEDVEVRGTTMRAGAGTPLPKLARRSAAAGLTGLEWAVGVPGSVGGALRMNAGGHGSDTAAVLTRYRVFDLVSGATVDADAAALELTYRDSSLRPGQVVLSADFALSPGDPAVAREELDAIVRWRREHQPGGSNAGSVFRNPDGDSAGRLVEAAGLRGARVGSARVSERHANFIQADEGGSADDVRRLMDRVRAEVAGLTGVVLVPEVHMVGFPDSLLPMVQASPSTSRRGATAPAGPGRGPR